MTSALDEYAAAITALSDRHIEALEALRVPPEIASGLLTDYPPVGITRVVTNANGLYEPHETGEPHYLCPCVYGDDVEDIVAWRPSSPSSWWTRTGVSALLNPSEPSRIALAQAWGESERLPLHETPFSWLQASCRGVVVLDWTVCLPLQFVGVTRFECESEDLAARLHDAYRIQDMPEIYIEEGLSDVA